MPLAAPIPVFVSCGHAASEGPAEFISAVEAHLKSHGCTPITVNRSKYSLRPVEAARDCIAECCGAVVIATERIRIEKAIEYPNSAQERNILNESHPTIWNQMEAAMAYSKNIPILTFVQTGLKRQGMLSNRFEWIALESDLSPDLLRTEKFRQIFDQWLHHVAKNSELKRKELDVESKSKELDVTEIKLTTLITKLNTKEAWAALVIAFGIVSGVATTAFKLGQTFPSTANEIKQGSSSNALKTSAPRPAP